MSFAKSRWSRRDFLGTAIATAGYLGVGSPVRAAKAATLITKPIPSSGERLPVIGLGTNNYSVDATEELTQRRAVIGRLVSSGCKVVDTAPAYGRSEIVVGQLLESLDARDDVFLATKVTTSDRDGAEGRAMIEASFDRLQTDRIDLLQVHNLTGTATLLPILAEMKEAGRIRYYGVTTSRAEQHTEMFELMGQHPLDFIQIDYSIENGAAAERILPRAAEKGIAVLINMPFGGRRGGNLFGETRGRELPGWAREIGISSWAQFMLKYVVAHPSVTCAIPGTHRPEHAADNFSAASGILPDAQMRERMRAHWETL